MPESLYIHVPFCRVKCAYCDFYSVAVQSGLAARYITALRKEIQRRAPGRLSTVFIGGGTPSVLPPGSISTILACLSEHAHIIEGAEVNVEANPESLTLEFIDEVKGCGVNRLSVGVQSFEDGLLRMLGRPHTSAEALGALELLKESGLDFSLDLMYSIPGQTPGAWERTLKTAIGLGPCHISAYELTIEHGTALDTLLSDGRISTPDEGKALAMYDRAKNLLTGAGYEHYEVSNYALPTKRSRHNMNYWMRGEYLGLGPGGVSFVEGKRTRNLPDVSGYCEAIERGEAPPHEDEVLGRAEASREFLMLGLRTSDGVEVAEASARYGLESLTGAASRFVENGMMALDEGRLCMSEKGMLLMNSVLVELFESLGI